MNNILAILAQQPTGESVPFLSQEQLLGLITGVIFGFFLQKGRVLRFDKQVGFLLFKDYTIIKFMFTAIAVGMIGINLLAQFDVISLGVKSLSLGAQVIGGVLFGIGWAIAGYCPGTAVGAIGEGRISAIWVVLGMLVGAGVYAEVYPWFKANVIPMGQYDVARLPDLLHVNQWVIIVIFVIAVAIYAYIDNKHKPKADNE